MAIWGNLAGTSGATWPVRSWSLCWDGRVFMVNCTINDMIHDQLWLLWCLTSDWSTVRACDVIKGYQTFFANKSLHKNGKYSRTNGLILFSSPRRIEWYAWWPWNHVTLRLSDLMQRDLRSTFDLDFSRSTHISFDADWRENYDGTRSFGLAWLLQKLFVKNCLRI